MSMIYLGFHHSRIQMYKDFYGFSKAPFHILPDIDFLFMSPIHKEALACMEFGLMRDIGLMLITGEIGIGKTTLIHHFIENIEDQVKIACLYSTNITPDQLLTMTLMEFGGSAANDGKAATLQALQQLLFELRSRNRRPLLIIDDAQNLGFGALEEIRLLSNLQSGTSALLQIVLVGQPELKMKLSDPKMASFAQRIGVSYHLRPLTAAETHEYISHRLKVVGGRPDLFSRQALDLIYETTSGSPRTINILCDNALVYGFVDELPSIDSDTVQQVIKESGVFFTGGKKGPAGDITDNPEDITRPLTAGSGTEAAQVQQRLEERMTSIEHQLHAYIKELHNQVKSQLIYERNRADMLSKECTDLKIKLEKLNNQRNMRLIK